MQTAKVTAMAIEMKRYFAKGSATAIYFTWDDGDLIWEMWIGWWVCFGIARGETAVRIEIGEMTALAAYDTKQQVTWVV